MRVLLAPGGMYPEPRGVPLAGAGTGLPAHRVARALADGWARARPRDVLRLLALPDGGAGSAASWPRGVTRSHRLKVAGPLGGERPVDLLCLTAPRQGAPCPSTWFLDAGSLLALPADPHQAGLHLLRGSSRGLGQALAGALDLVGGRDTLVVGLGRSAVHDGGSGLVQALGGVEGAQDVASGRDLVLALADTTALGGVAGAGRELAGLTDLEPAVIQEADRAACTTAVALAAGLSGPAPRPVHLVPRGLAEGEVVRATAWGTGAAGGCALVLRSLGARALPGPRVISGLVGLDQEVAGADLVVTAVGEAYTLLEDSVPVVAGQAAASTALPAVLVAGRARLPRSELAQAGLGGLLTLGQGWPDPHGLEEELRRAGARLARTWSR